MDHLAAMRAFVRVVEAGTFTSAARALNVHTPTVTRLVQSLERHLQVRLLQRSTRSMAMTTEGEAYYSRAVRVLTDLADMESFAKQSTAIPSGCLRVECAAAIGTTVIVPALPEFHRSYPEVTMHLCFESRSVDLISRGVDCAIRAGAVDEQYVVARRIGQLRYATCATPQFLDMHGVPASPNDIRPGTAIRMYSTLTGQASPFRFTTDSGARELSPAHSLLVDDIHAYLAAGLAGLGMIQAPEYVVRDALLSGKLVAVLDDWQPPSIPLYVVFLPNRFLSAKLRVFIDWIVQIFQHHADLTPG
jgi:DNA-binding transcriptional LysR family regulator